MEKRLYFYIMNPAAVLVWFSGIYLGHVLGFDTWLIVKIGVVLIMTAYHILLGIHLNDFKLDKQFVLQDIFESSMKYHFPSFHNFNNGYNETILLTNNLDLRIISCVWIYSKSNFFQQGEDS